MHHVFIPSSALYIIFLCAFMFTSCVVCVYYIDCRSFVLKLWKFLHTVILQRQHTILDSVVAELAPLPLSAVSFLKCEGASQTLEDSFADKIQVSVLLCGIYNVRHKKCRFAQSIVLSWIHALHKVYAIPIDCSATCTDLIIGDYTEALHI